MTAPERIWATHYYGKGSSGFWNDAPITPNKPENQGTEYIRADDAEAEVARLRAALEDIADPTRLTSHGDPTVLRDRARAALAGKG